MTHRIPYVYQRSITGGDPYPGVERLTVPQVALWLNCSRSFVYKMVDDGTIAAVRIGSRKGLRISKVSVSEYLAKQGGRSSRSG